MLFTIGHGTAGEDELVGLLAAAGIGELVDVRTAPRSRHNPAMTRAAMTHWLPGRGIGYRWDPRLGGWRTDPPGSPDTALRTRSFAGYAAHMRTAEFTEALDELLGAAQRTPTTVMCSESVWWRCHRRLIADVSVLAHDIPVRHLMHDGRVQEHRPTDGVRLRDDGLLVYDAGQEPLAGSD